MYKRNKLSIPAVPLALAMALVIASGCSKNDKVAALPVAATPQANLAPITVNKGTSSAASHTEKTLLVSGKVLNLGYVANATVCFDSDDNGECNNAEPISLTDAQGAFRLEVPQGKRGTHLLAVITRDSKDTANTADKPVLFKYGRTIPALLEYDDGATHVQRNITNVALVYLARQRVRGRGRESNQINTFQRLVGEPNINPVTGEFVLNYDFDYQAQPQNTLANRLYDFHQLLELQSEKIAKPLSALESIALGYALYNTYTNANAKEPARLADATKVAAQIADGSDVVGDFIKEDHTHFKSSTDAVSQLRIGLTETTGWSRTPNSGDLNKIGRRSLYLKNGKAALTFEEWQNGVWQPITVSEPVSFTIAPDGSVATVGSTDSQQPRTISAVDGNRLSMRMPGNQARVAYEFSNSPGTHFFIEEWVDEQTSINWYYGDKTPTNDPITEAPACAKNYPGYRHQPELRGTGLSNWYTQCFDYYTAEYFSEVLGDINLTYQDPDMPGATFYDITLLDPIIILPANKNCGDKNPISKITTNKITHCNWAVDANDGHEIGDLFSPDGILIHSWNNVYGKSDFTVEGENIVAGTPEQFGQPQQLRLRLKREGNATSGKAPFLAPTAPGCQPTTVR